MFSIRKKKIVSKKIDNSFRGLCKDFALILKIELKALTWYAKDFVLARLISHAARLLLHERLIDAGMIGLSHSKYLEIAQILLMRLIRLIVLLILVLVIFGNFIEVLVMLRIKLSIEFHHLLLMLVRC